MVHVHKYGSGRDTPAEPKPKLPECQQIITGPAGGRAVCRMPGRHCDVYGTFGSISQVLCSRCQKTLRDRGWKVQLKLVSDNPQ